MCRDVEQRIVADQAVAGEVPLLRLSLAPGGDLLQDGEESGVAAARLDAVPSFLRVQAVCRWVGPHRHLLLPPGGTARPLHPAGQLHHATPTTPTAPTEN